MAASVNFIPMLSITNQMTYNASNFWNGNLAILGGIAVAAIAFRIAPPEPPPIRARRLLALTLADLRRLAGRAAPGRLDAWEGRGFARLLAMPDEAQPVQRAELVSIVAVGKEILRLRRAAPRFIASGALGAAPRRWPRDEAARRLTASSKSTVNSRSCPPRGPRAAS
jgi:uncharacterized membrane protein YccC